MTNNNAVPNRLIYEKSPYLLQHAYNPVDWFPWGEEAFAKAEREDKPIFLSIGYSTCHWCHVMAHESFEDDEVAEKLNNNFISIKVDREERPDVDAVYMNVAQKMTGSGGWPLTIIMTPKQKPFFAATYIPKIARYNMKGLLEILDIVVTKWKNNSDELINSGNQITELIKSQEEKEYKKLMPTKKLIFDAKNIFVQNFDEEYGGFGSSPKFPQPSNLMFLLRYYKMENDDDALYMVEKTLESMYRGGIYDHIGYGFSRYSTDDKWLVPHFEKMLYDNAQLVIVLTEAYQITKNNLYKNIVAKTLDYILREMTDDNGGFYSAQDADSEGEEGKYYVYTLTEIIDVLGEVDGKYFINYYNVNKQGNFEGKNILNLLNNEDYYKKDDRIESLNIKLYDYRLERTKLHKDDKILTSWNGMMIAALALAYKVFGDSKYLKAAEKAVDFIEENLIDENNKISVRFREGSVIGNGTLDDYAFYVWSLIEMYNATYNFKFLSRAIKLNNKMIDLFWDSKNGGFYMTSNEGESLIYNPKEVYDGALPSGNSVASNNLMRLAKITGNIVLEEVSTKQIAFLTDMISEYPAGYTFALISLMYELYPTKEIVCMLNNNEGLEDINNILKTNFIINTTIVVVDYDDLKEVGNTIEFIKDYKLKNNKTTFYICENRECSLPITDINELVKILDSD